MARDDLNHRLSQIATDWIVLRQAQDGPADQARAALQLLVERYRGAVYRYLCRLLGDAAAADDLTQEFSLALLRGELRRADPSRGRFRHYIKAILRHLASKHQQRISRQPAALSCDSPVWGELAGSGGDAGREADRVFDESWRDELLARTWEALRQAQPTYHAVLEYRASHPDVPSQEMAQPLTARLGKPLTPEGVRQTLHRARAKFANLLFDEVAHSLDAPGPDQVEAELAELGLLEYCRPVLDQR